MEEIIRYPGCFVCGHKNLHGLNARFFWDGKAASTEVVLTEQFEGYRGISHGGVVSALLDEVMIKAVLATNRQPVTAELTVKFLKPARTGIPLKFVGYVVSAKGRLFACEATATDPDSTVIAKAEAKFLEGSKEFTDELRRSFE